MTSHCAGAVHMREESESRIRKWEEMWSKMTAKDGDRGCSSDVRWKTIPQTSGCDTKRRQWTYVERRRTETLMRQNVWLNGKAVKSGRSASQRLSVNLQDIPRCRIETWTRRPRAADVRRRSLLVCTQTWSIYTYHTDTSTSTCIGVRVQ